MKTYNEDLTYKVLDWCFDIYSQHGISLRLPKNTKPQNTYQWRYCKAIADKFIEWEFDDEESKYFIHTAVNYSKRLGILKKGLAVLHQKNMLNVIHKLMEKDQYNNGRLRISLIDTNEWLKSQTQDNNPLDILLYRHDRFSSPNIVIWYGANKISRLYIALSKCCYTATNKLEYPEREQLPSTAELYKLRSNFISDLMNLEEARNILGKDWRNVC